AISKITKQIDYEFGSGEYYSLLMGREFKPGRWSVLLDFDNKADDASQSGTGLINKLKMDQYGAPKQKTLPVGSTTSSTLTPSKRTASPRARQYRIRAPYTTWTSRSRMVCAIAPLVI
ncbi:MAG: hypothetical protein ACKPKO_47665, partial [Candidatus Fonsibacter sp.]